MSGALPKESNVVVAFVMCSFAPLLDTGLDSMSDMTYIDSNETVRETTRMACFVSINSPFAMIIH